MDTILITLPYIGVGIFMTLYVIERNKRKISDRALDISFNVVERMKMYKAQSRPANDQFGTADIQNNIDIYKAAMEQEVKNKNGHIDRMYGELTKKDNEIDHLRGLNSELLAASKAEGDKFKNELNDAFAYHRKILEQLCEACAMLEEVEHIESHDEICLAKRAKNFFIKYPNLKKQ